jgi:ferritin
MLNERMEKALNEHLNAELYSAYLYMAMSADFQDKNLPGFAHWMAIQAQEEMVHAQKFYKFILDRGGRVTLLPIEGPRATWESVQAAFKAGYGHEQLISSKIHDLYALAEELRDYPTRVFLHWFIDEQVEEEATADEWVKKIQRVEHDPSGLYAADQEASTRVFDLALALNPPK